MTSLLPAPPSSPTQDALLNMLGQHEEDEQALIDSYMTLADGAPEHVKYLVALIVRDEEHHRSLVQEMYNAVQGEVEWRAIEPAVPPVQFTASPQPRWLEVTSQLLDLERADLKKLKSMRRRLRRMKDGSLFGILAEQMEFDTRKHIALLERIQHWAAGKRR